MTKIKLYTFFYLGTSLNLQYVLRQEIEAVPRQGKLGYDTLRTASAITRYSKTDMAILNNATLGQRDETSVSLHQRAIKCKTDES